MAKLYDIRLAGRASSLDQLQRCAKLKIVFYFKNTKSYFISYFSNTLLDNILFSTSIYFLAYRFICKKITYIQEMHLCVGVWQREIS